MQTNGVFNFDFTFEAAKDTSPASVDIIYYTERGAMVESVEPRVAAHLLSIKDKDIRNDVAVNYMRLSGSTHGNKFKAAVEAFLKRIVNYKPKQNVTTTE